MKILLTNDDGYRAPGIQTLYETLCMDHEVILVAPDRERSAVGHGLTINDPLRIHQLDLNGSGRSYATNGTPADCIKLALFEIFDTPPDLVVSGINPGSNTGVNMNYSGTVAAAREAALNKIPSLAVSIRLGPVLDFKGMSRFTARVADHMDQFHLPPTTFLNINGPAIPIDQVRGVKITRQGSNNVSKHFEKRLDVKNNPYFWYGRLSATEEIPGTDDWALSQECISITPVQCDLTNYKTAENPKENALNLEGLLENSLAKPDTN